MMVRGRKAEHIYLTQFSVLIKAGIITKHQTECFPLLLSLGRIFFKEDNNKIASPSHNCRPGGVLIFTLELVQSGGKFVLYYM